MVQFRSAFFVSLLLMGALVPADHARAQSLIATPGTSGDQLLFFYDARPGRVPFLVVANIAPAALTLEVAWYSQNLSQRLATQFLPLAIGANVILDPSQVQGVAGNAGLTVVTPVMSSTDARPVVPPAVNDTLPSAPSGSLVGGFTLADTSTNSAFGQNPLARIAVDANGKRATAGAIVDGATIRYQQIAPDVLVIPFYFNPNGSPPLTNRAILGAFEDRYAAGSFSIGPVSLELGFALVDANGDDVANGTFPVSGVAFTDVQSLAGATQLTRSGKVVLGSNSPLPANANLLGLMSQSLGTFAVGQGLPGYFATQARFVDNGDGTVTDRQTGLQWEQKVSPGGGATDPHDVDNTYEWTLGGGGDTFPDGAVFTDFLFKLNGASSDGVTLTGCFAGHCDWRLPTIVELRTILLAPFPCGTSLCIDPVFGPTVANIYWSATTNATFPGFAWYVDFLDGGVDSSGKGSSHYVRAVRAGS